jgi:hypothetical protein
MKITVGELVKAQAIADGIRPELIQNVLNPLGPTLEAMRNVTKKMEEPMKAAAKIAESLQPQIDAIQKLKLSARGDLVTRSFIPNSMRDESGEVFIPQLTRPVQEVRIVNHEDISSGASKKEKSYLIGSYPLPQNANWESLTIQFIDGHFVKVSYVGMNSKKFDYKDMGFINMKTVKPDLKWELLRAIAENDGALLNAKWDRKFGRNVKYELNEGLKKFFKMNDNPIPHYTKKRGYQTLFSIKSDK